MMHDCFNCKVCYQEKDIKGNFKDKFEFRNTKYICNYCYNAVIDLVIERNRNTSWGSFPVKKISYEELETKVKKLEEELSTERNTNLAMLENLKVLNEQKYNDRLASALKEKTQRIEFLEKLLFENSLNL